MVEIRFESKISQSPQTGYDASKVHPAYSVRTEPLVHGQSRQLVDALSRHIICLIPFPDPSPSIAPGRSVETIDN
jgi:histidine ammonia-lyase